MYLRYCAITFDQGSLLNIYNCILNTMYAVTGNQQEKLYLAIVYFLF